jgi:cobalt-zinc-cadmium efflux system outer membrane protein
MASHIKSLRRALAPPLVLLLAGCASVPADLGRGDVDALATAHGRPAEAKRSEEDAKALVAELTAAPLTAEAAVRIALVQSPRLQRTYAQLGFVAAEVYEAGRMSNPRLGFSVLDSNVAGEDDQVTLGLALSFTDLLTLPTRNRLAKADYARFKQALGSEVVELAANVEAAYYRLVGAKQIAALRRRVADAATLSATLADRFRDAGNLTPRDHALEQAAGSEARIHASRADADALAARLELARLLGLATKDSWDVPTALPWPIGSDDDVDALVDHAGKTRLDLAAAKARVEVLADWLGVTRWTRWVGDVEVGVEREREPDGSRRMGPTLAIEIPIFDQRRGRLLRAQAELEEATVDLKALALDVENQVRVSYATLRNARARLVEHRDVLVPQREAAVARTQEEVNFMLRGVFELLIAKQQEYDAYQGYLEAARDYWLARVELTRAVGDALPSSADASASTLDLDELVKPTGGSMDMEGMEGMDHSKHGPSEPAPKKDDDPPQGNHDHHGGTP